jgi:hypothetical protein
MSTSKSTIISKTDKQLLNKIYWGTKQMFGESKDKDHIPSKYDTPVKNYRFYNNEISNKDIEKLNYIFWDTKQTYNLSKQDDPIFTEQNLIPKKKIGGYIRDSESDGSDSGSDSGTGYGTEYGTEYDSELDTNLKTFYGWGKSISTAGAKSKSELKSKSESKSELHEKIKDSSMSDVSYDDESSTSFY